MIKKIIALTLCFTILNSPLVWATAPNAQPLAHQQPQSLAQYQQQAKKDIQKAPWIKKEGVTILGIGGTALALLIVQRVRYQLKLNAVSKDLLDKTVENINLKASYEQALKAAQTEVNNQKLINKRLGNIYQTESAKSEKTISELLSSNKYLQQQLRHQTNMAEGFKEAQKVWAEEKAQYQSSLDQLQRRFSSKKNHYMDLVSYSKDLDDELKIYEKLFDSRVPSAERETLFKKLSQEPWLKAATEQQQKEFLHIVKQASVVGIGGGKESASNYMRLLIRWSIEKNMPLYERLMGMCRHLFHSNNLLVIGLMVTLGLASHDANAQSMANRIQSNFNLFLNATPQELAQMEKNEDVRTICIQGAQALHEISQMTPQQAAFIKEGLNTNPSSQAAQQLRSSTKHLSR